MHNPQYIPGFVLLDIHTVRKLGSRQMLKFAHWLRLFNDLSFSTRGDQCIALTSHGLSWDLQEAAPFSPGYPFVSRLNLWIASLMRTTVTICGLSAALGSPSAFSFLFNRRGEVFRGRVSSGIN